MSWLRAGMWGAGHCHAMVSTHLPQLAPTTSQVKDCSLGGVSPAWGGGSSPCLCPGGQSHGEEERKARAGGNGGRKGHGTGNGTSLIGGLHYAQWR